MKKILFCWMSPAARKDIVGTTNILKKMDYMFIPTDDLEHILSGVIMPMLPSQNRIEDMSDQLTFLDVVLDLLIAKKKEISEEELSKYLQKIMGAMAYPRKDMEKKNLSIYLTRCLRLFVWRNSVFLFWEQNQSVSMLRNKERF